MPSQLTFTGKIGAAVQLTTKVFPDVQQMGFDFSRRTLQVNYLESPGSQPKEAALDMSGATVTVTDTVSLNQHTWVISVT